MDPNFLHHLTEVFVNETCDSLIELANKLALLDDEENDENYRDALLCLHRELHGIKGGAGCISWSRMEKICQLLENHLYGACNKEERISDTEITFLNRIIRYLIPCFQKGVNQEEGEIIEENLITEEIHNQLLEALENIQEYEKSSSQEAIEPPPAAKTAKREAIEPPPAAKTAKKDLLPIHDDGSGDDEVVFSNNISISSGKFNKFLLKLEELKLFENFFDTSMSSLDELENRLEFLNRADFQKQSELAEGHDIALEEVFKFKKYLSEKQRATKYVFTALEKTMEEMLMLPIPQFFQKFSSWSKSIASKVNKKVRLSIEQNNIVVDKRVLDQMKDPIIHLIRNAIDHGLEPPLKRKELGKSELGLISIRCKKTDNNYLRIVVEDDGAGLSVQKIKQKALEKNLYSEEILDSLSDKEIFLIIFNPYFSTSEIITDISGRGVGMNSVENAVLKLGGQVFISSEKNCGTKITMEIPISITALQGNIVKTHEALSIIPFQDTFKAIKLATSSIHQNLGTMSFEQLGVNIPLFSLHHLYDEEFNIEDYDFVTVVIVSQKSKKLGIIVSEIVAQKEIQSKTLTHHLKEAPYLSGYAIIGDRTVVPILNCKQLFSILDFSGKVKHVRDKVMDSKKTILVVDDVLTPRMLMKSILEAAGYHVLSAVNGQEGWNILSSNKNIDMLITDIEMPVMDGFELIQKVRSHQYTASLPTAIVTTQSSEESKQKGIEVGANAYIVKGEFKGDTLLDIVKTWI